VFKQSYLPWVKTQGYRLSSLRDWELTIVEAQGNSRRYYKAYIADRLDDQWKRLADTREQPFAAFENVVQDKAWTNNISHGELIRAGFDEKLEVDPSNLQMLFQGANAVSRCQRPGISRQQIRIDSLADGIIDRIRSRVRAIRVVNSRDRPTL